MKTLNNGKFRHSTHKEIKQNQSDCEILSDQYLAIKVLFDQNKEVKRKMYIRNSVIELHERYLSSINDFSINCLKDCVRNLSCLNDYINFVAPYNN